MKSFPFSTIIPALSVVTILAAAAAGRADVFDATLVGDTYVRTSVPDESFVDSYFGLYVRNHRQHGRIALMQFALPKKLCESGSAEEIVDAQLSVMVSFTGWAERDITLELLALDNPGDGKNFDLATLTYDDLVRAGVITGYGEGKFRYGKSVSSVQTLSLFSARGIANATLSFGGKMLLERIRAAILAGQTTLTFAIAPSASTPPDDVDIRFYSRKTAALSEALSPPRLQLTDTAPEAAPVTTGLATRFSRNTDHSTGREEQCDTGLAALWCSWLPSLFAAERKRTPCGIHRRTLPGN